MGLSVDAALAAATSLSLSLFVSIFHISTLERCTRRMGTGGVYYLFTYSFTYLFTVFVLFGVGGVCVALKNPGGGTLFVFTVFIDFGGFFLVCSADR